MFGYSRNRRLDVEQPAQEEEEEENDCYYEYNHATGRHVLVPGNSNKTDPNRPNYSLKCCLCNCIDALIFLGCIAFLFFAIRFAFYCLENADNGGDGGGGNSSAL